MSACACVGFYCSTYNYATIAERPTRHEVAPIWEEIRQMVVDFESADVPFNLPSIKPLNI
ncbi:hypothetical protein BLOT_012242 [Blomia tropicalis]|nr:hypothetical protein BLOT_012242 [Blomia tropicalis]